METVCHNQLRFESLCAKEVVADFAWTLLIPLLSHSQKSTQRLFRSWLIEHTFMDGRI